MSTDNKSYTNHWGYKAYSCYARRWFWVQKTLVMIQFLRWNYRWVTGPREGASVRGSPLAVVMIHVWMKQVHVANLVQCPYAKHLPTNTWTCLSVKWSLTGLHLSHMSIKWWKTTVALVDSVMMMQLCRHNWEVKNLQQCTWLLAIPTISYLAGYHIVKLRLSRITCAADVIAICEYEGSTSSCAKWWENLRHSPVIGRLRPKHAVSEGLMTLAEDKRSEANWLIELRPYALQHQTRHEYEVDVSLSTLAEYRLVTH